MRSAVERRWVAGGARSPKIHSWPNPPSRAESPCACPPRWRAGCARARRLRWADSRWCIDAWRC
jgi:hypothetical protein